jgi:16S rRNA (guanine527-N7)-methyltransferase
LELGRIQLAAEQIDRLEQYWQLLERWNSKINLTSLPLRDCPAHTLDRLIVEPLVAASLMPSGSLDWYDVGSGGGSPAVPLKLARPSARLTMVESRSRKAAFLREVLRNIDLTATSRVENARVESVAAGHPATADWLTVRAVRVNSTLIEAAVRLLRPGGSLMLFESIDSAKELPEFKLNHKVEFPATTALIRVLVPRGTSG